MFKYCNFLEYFLLEWILDWTLLCAFVVDPPVLIYMSVDPSTNNHFSSVMGHGVGQNPTISLSVERARLMNLF